MRSTNSVCEFRVAKAYEPLVDAQRQRQAAFEACEYGRELRIEVAGEWRRYKCGRLP